MTHPGRPSLGMFVAIGVSAGALAGLVIGLLVRRSAVPEQMNETVDDLKRRAEMILSELSKDHVPISGDKA